MSDKYNIAVILAAGNGSRFGNDIPKQFIEVENKTIFEYAVEKFEINQNINEIAIVANFIFVEKIKEIIKKNNWKKIKLVLIGGKERFDSSFVAVRAFANKKNTNIIFHDAARPLVSSDIINNVINALKYYNAVNTAVAITDTIVKINNEKQIIEIPNRNNYLKCQTPQAFNIETIKQAYENGLKDKNFTATDDCSIVKKYLPNEKIFIVNGEERNIKITYMEDIFVFKSLIK